MCRNVRRQIQISPCRNHASLLYDDSKSLTNRFILFLKENEAKEKKMKKKEMTRLINMVMLAEKTDPRITADKVR